MTKKERIDIVKHDCGHAKSELIHQWQRLKEISPSQAIKLDKIICKLEAWQNSHR
jgi:hypothetical protein